MAAAVQDLLSQHSTNSVKITGYKTGTDKAIIADFEGPLLLDYDDDAVRWAHPAFPPNKRQWRLETEEGCSDWFKAEVSNVVLAAWTDYPALLQVSHAEAFSDISSSETVDLSYTFTHLNRKVPVVCRQVPVPPDILLDGGWLLMLQFRAESPGNIKDPGCEIDCWLVPRGFRRCQSYHWPAAAPTRVGGLRSEPDREFFSGRPVWKVDGESHSQHPGGFRRAINPVHGAFYWTHSDQSLLPVGQVLWDTRALWHRRQDAAAAGPVGSSQGYEGQEAENT
ncbi:hypothetical protein B0T24DRAFT_650609 [Lasiosphaeria ovina]|uniref:Uncharacterized protein n=1 Tax=Lasiosphaeria ovina TaxID=92902 RepID=A0AAE0N6B4_9PEZI|nr:hypothetical protein B0T24DRAFT_650609 [Lasiosphaeria ovina]